MHPTICQIGPIVIHSYGVMVAVAAVLCSMLMARECARIQLKPDDIFDLVFWAVIGGIFGARVFYILLNWSFFAANPQDIIMIHKGGLAWQGGVIFGTFAVIALLKYKRWPLLILSDFIAPYLALGHAIGRIGCFLNGCCYGREVSWGIYFPVHGARLHPTQLYETALLLGVFFILKKLQSKYKKFPGSIFAFYVISASIIRFGVEFFRADHAALFFQLSIFQYMSILFFLCGIGLFFYVRRCNV